MSLVLPRGIFPVRSDKKLKGDRTMRNIFFDVSFDLFFAVGFIIGMALTLLL